MTPLFRVLIAYAFILALVGYLLGFASLALIFAFSFVGFLIGVLASGEHDGLD